MIDPPGGDMHAKHDDSDSELSDDDETGCSAAVGRTTTAMALW